MPGARGRLLFALAAMVSRKLNALPVMWVMTEVGGSVRVGGSKGGAILLRFQATS